MRISARCCYAILAAAELARADGGRNTVPVKELSARTGVPRGFLMQILHSLRKAGVVGSVRGAGGGYRLAAPPEEISIGRILGACGGGERYIEVPGSAARVLEAGGHLEAVRALGLVLDEAEASLDRTFRGMTLAALLERARGGRESP